MRADVTRERGRRRRVTPSLSVHPTHQPRSSADGAARVLFGAAAPEAGRKESATSHGILSPGSLDAAKEQGQAQAVSQLLMTPTLRRKPGLPVEGTGRGALYVKPSSLSAWGLALPARLDPGSCGAALEFETAQAGGRVGCLFGCFFGRCCSSLGNRNDNDQEMRSCKALRYSFFEILSFLPSLFRPTSSITGQTAYPQAPPTDPPPSPKARTSPHGTQGTRSQAASC